MKFCPIDISDQNINITPVNPWRELLVIISGVLGILLLLYIVSGIALSYIVPSIPLELEKQLGILVTGYTEDPLRDSNPLQQKAQNELQQLTDRLSGNIPDFIYPKINVYLVQSNQANAISLPGGKIVVFSELLKYIETENELAMILAHELGHFSARDHLMSAGRKLFLGLGITILLGPNNINANTVSLLFDPLDNSYSHSQEYAADEFALNLLNQTYSHVSGSTGFFLQLNSQKSGNQTWEKSLELLQTHPLTEKRISRLNQLAINNSYSASGKNTDLPNAIMSFKNSLSSDE